MSKENFLRRCFKGRRKAIDSSLKSKIESQAATWEGRRDNTAAADSSRPAGSKGKGINENSLG